MRFLFVVSFLYFTFGSIHAQSEILGRWLTAEKDAHIEIYKNGEEYEGKIVWLDEPTRPDGSIPRDDNNPDESLRERPIMNMVMLSGFTYSRGQYRNGSIYDARNGKTYNSKMWLDDNNTLMMRGYLGPFYRTVELTRVQ
ncbi:MAG: DUF2147 domain-containing protein [Bacteroidota bacterium]